MTDGDALLDFAEDMRRLRSDCPWKREQTHRSLARYLQEETAETLEAIDTGDLAHLREELGDLLLQVYFHAVIAEESGDFTLDDVARGIAEKMRLRNPHVFGSEGGATTMTAAEVDAEWQRIKQREKPRRSAYDGIAPQLSALLLATKVLERSPDADLPASSEDLGDRLLSLVREAVVAGVDPEQALRDALRRVVPDRLEELGSSGSGKGLGSGYGARGIQGVPGRSPDGAWLALRLGGSLPPKT